MVNLTEHDLSIFQLTTSHRGRRIFSTVQTYTVVFQLTTSHRGRQVIYLKVSDNELFQLTTSHRGRPDKAES